MIQPLLILKKLRCVFRGVFVQCVVFVNFDVPRSRGVSCLIQDIVRAFRMFMTAYPFVSLFAPPLCSLLSVLCNFSNNLAVLS
jgi:hypothetical protein